MPILACLGILLAINGFILYIFQIRLIEKYTLCQR